MKKARRLGGWRAFHPAGGRLPRYPRFAYCWTTRRVPSGMYSSTTPPPL
jgi:hypothetical protein